MHYTIHWDNDAKTVVLQQYHQGATKDDWYQMARESAQMLGTVPHTVYLIIDEHHIEFDANSADMRYLEKQAPANEGACVIVVPRHQQLYKTIKKKIREKTVHNEREAYFVETIDEARQLLKELFGVVYNSTV